MINIGKNDKQVMKTNKIRKLQYTGHAMKDDRYLVQQTIIKDKID